MRQIRRPRGRDWSLTLILLALWLTACGAAGASTAVPTAAEAPAAATSAPPATIASTLEPAGSAPAPTGAATEPPVATANLVATTAPIAAPTVAATAGPSATAVPTVVLAATLTAAATTVLAGALPTPVCTPGTLTPALTEGPYYKSNPPQRSSLLEPGMAGTKLTLTGYVLTADCKPAAGARVDFWQADAAGQYDNAGYTLRGYQLTDAAGRYQLETVIPGLYPGRTEHIHVKVTAAGGPTLTTQLFFPDVAQNSQDSIFDPKLVLDLKPAADGSGQTAAFDFVVPAQ